MWFPILVRWLFILNQCLGSWYKSHLCCIKPHLIHSVSWWYSEKAWACVQNGITQRGRLARQGELSCLHTLIPELCNAILNTCQMSSRFYIIPSNVNKSQTHLFKSFIARDLMEGHICMQTTLMFALVFCFELRARAACTCCHCHLAVKNPIHDGNRGQLKLPKSHERYHNVVMWHWIVYKWRRSKRMLSFHRTFFNLLDFTVLLSCRDWRSETQWSHSSNQPGGTYYQHRISYCAPIIHWKCDARMQNIVALNG